MLGDHGVDPPHDRLLLLLAQAFERLEAAEQADVGELRVLDLGAGEQVVDRRIQRLGELDQHVHGRVVESALVLVELLEPDPQGAGKLLLWPVLGLPQRLDPNAHRLAIRCLHHGLPLTPGWSWRSVRGGSEGVWTHGPNTTSK